MSNNYESVAVENLRRKKNFRYALVFEGVMIGMVTGVLISVFRLMLVAADKLRGWLVDFARLGIFPGGNSETGQASIPQPVAAGVTAVILLAVYTDFLRSRKKAG